MTTNNYFTINQDYNAQVILAQPVKYKFLVPIWRNHGKTFTNQFCLVDEEDYQRFGLTNGKLHFINDYVGLTIKGVRKPLHQWILPVEPPLTVDHIDRNKLNNTRENLRPATRIQQGFNRNKFKTMKGEKPSSNYKGVTLERAKASDRPLAGNEPTKGRWRAQITINGKIKYINSFSDEIEAAKAYDKEAKEIGKGFECLNFP